MKNSLLTAGNLLACFVLFVGSLAVAGTAICYPVANTVVTVTKETEKPGLTEKILFPVSVPGTPLTVERLMVYEGPRIEQSSDEPIVDVLALLLHNAGEHDLLSAEVLLQSDGITHSFRGSYIPANSRVMLIETDNAVWPGPDYTACSGTVLYADGHVLTNRQIKITETGMGEVTIMNMTDHPISAVSVLHKNYLVGMDIYMGGITYRTEIGDLMPGETVSKQLDHYASGYSKVVRVEGKTE